MTKKIINELTDKIMDVIKKSDLKKNNRMFVPMFNNDFSVKEVIKMEIIRAVKIGV